jgi:acetylornithine/succinyldiaminopimelate/putrescine aminotransferase
MSGVYFCNSGAEANETALKMARKATGRPLVIAMNGCFHGRTIGSLSITGMPKLRDAFPQNIADRTRFVDLGDMDAVRAVPPQEVAAVILEPVQSLAGVRLCGADYYRKLKEHCSRHGILLVFDEVQTGSGRTGKWFVGQHWDVEPDLVTTAKGVAGGFPVGVVIAGDRVARDVQTGDQGSTFGGGPLAAAAVAATYRIILEENLLEAVARRSAMVLDRLRDMVRRERIREVRGLGYLLGVECAGPARDVQARLRDEGILVGGSYHPGTFRLLPPYTVEDSHWERFFEVFERVCA